MKFRVTVKNTQGTEEERTVDAASRFEVYEQVEKEGARVLSIEEGGGKMSLASLGNISFGKPNAKIEQKITFTKNLSAMLSAGLTLSRALSVIERQSPSKVLVKVTQDLQAQVKAGTSFHEALQKHEQIFSKLFIAMTKAGEESGDLSNSLGLVAKQMDRAYTLQKKVKGAMIYPGIILTAIVIIGILMMLFVVPTLSATFASLNVELPVATRVIVAISDFMTHNVIAVLGILAVMVTAGVMFVRSKTGGTLILLGALHMPVIGELVRETFSARMARTLSSLLSSGVEMLTALSITKEVVGAETFSRVVAEAEEKVRRGEPLSAAFIKYPKLYPVFVGDMIAVGEETGKVADMLGQVAQYYETDVEDRTKDLSTIIEPLLMLFIGAFVGVFAVAMIAPIYSLSSKI